MPWSQKVDQGMQMTQSEDLAVKLGLIMALGLSREVLWRECPGGPLASMLRVPWLARGGLHPGKVN